MRVSSHQLLDAAIRSIQKHSVEAMDWQQQISSGLQLERNRQTLREGTGEGQSEDMKCKMLIMLCCCYCLLCVYSPWIQPRILKRKKEARLTSRGLSGLVCRSRTSEREREGECVKEGGGEEGERERERAGRVRLHYILGY